MGACNCGGSDGLAGGCRGKGMGRREFLRLAGAGAAAVGACGRAVMSAGPSPDHFVPSDKKLSPDWIRSLTDRGGRSWYEGADLETIGMPVGGVAAGQVYLAGDGRLTYWGVFNKRVNTGFGKTCYDECRRPPSPLEQGFAIRVVAGSTAAVRSLDARGFPGVRFCGEYPLGYVEYADGQFPVKVALEAFSPFIPLRADDSALPATVMRFTATNSSSETVEVTLAGWLQNAVACHSAADGKAGTRFNRLIRDGKMTMVVGGAKESAEPPGRAPIVFADFEGKDYGPWQVEGEALGTGPARGTLRGQQTVSGFLGQGLVNTFLGGDKPQGKLLSPEFTVERPFISFLLGGGKNPGETCVNLLVDGKVVRSSTGENSELLTWQNWDVRDLAGRKARIIIRDSQSSPWGHVNVDQIEFRDGPRSGLEGPLDRQADYGTMALAVLAGEGTVGSASLPDGALPANLFSETDLAAGGAADKPFDRVLRGAVGQTFTLAPGAAREATFVAAWCFPNLPHPAMRFGPDRNEAGSALCGQHYANRFADAEAVVRHVAAEMPRLAGLTRLWHDTWYDSTLPRWLLDRLHSTVSILATNTCQWWRSGRFWAWEGEGCCHGTCSHVWNYAHAPARLQPQLERSVRTFQDYGAGFDEQTGMVHFRGENWKLWAGDGQAGTVLKAWREHRMSADVAFLKGLWPKVRKSLEFLIEQDGNADGLLEGKQHNTYDIDFYGANTMVGSLYLAALRAGEEMAREMEDADFAATCRRIYESGWRLSVERLFNGEYFIQTVDLAKHPKFQYGQGCLADQLFGQSWAHEIGLGHIYPPETVRSALEAIWKYNWAPDVAAQNRAHAPERWFARPGEGGLFICTWPRGRHMGDNGVRYRDEVWTGIEYQVAGNMVWDGMLSEALAVCRAIHDRYHPRRHNPWNEVECGDHYARAMASWGVFTALCGYEYHGPAGRMGVSPRLGSEDFRAAFTAAEGWGRMTQKRQGGAQTNSAEVRWGRLRLRTFVLDLPAAAKPAKVEVTAAGRAVQAAAEQAGARLTLRLAEEVVLEAGQALEVRVAFQAGSGRGD